MDPLAILPFLVPFLGSVDAAHRRKVVRDSLATDSVVGLVFLRLGIDVSDFLIAGGIVLLGLPLSSLLSSRPETPTAPSELPAVVPIGTPLLVGPATISMLILLSGLYGWGMAFLGFAANIVVAWVVFSQSDRITSFLGAGGLQAFSKVAYFLLAAIAVQLVRKGLTDIWNAL